MNNCDFLRFALSDKWYIFPANITFLGVHVFESEKKTDIQIANEFEHMQAGGFNNRQTLLTHWL